MTAENEMTLQQIVEWAVGAMVIMTVISVALLIVESIKRVLLDRW